MDVAAKPRSTRQSTVASSSRARITRVRSSCGTRVGGRDGGRVGAAPAAAAALVVTGPSCRRRNKQSSLLLSAETVASLGERSPLCLRQREQDHPERGVAGWGCAGCREDTDAMADYAGTVIVGAGVSGLATAYFLRRLLGPRHLDHRPGHRHGRRRQGAHDHAGRPARSTRGRTPSCPAPRAARPDRRPRPGRAVSRPSAAAPTSGRAAACARCHRAWPSVCPNAWSHCCARGCSRPRRLCAPGFDLVLPASDSTGEDPSVAELVRPRFGDRGVRPAGRPLLGGVHAGDPARSARAAPCPEITALARSGRSVYLALRRRRRAAPQPDRSGPCAAGLPVGRPRPARRRPARGPRPRRGGARVAASRASSGCPTAATPWSPSTGARRPRRSCWPRRRTSPPTCSPSLRPGGRGPAARDPLRRRRERDPRVPPPRTCPTSRAAPGFLVPPVEGELIVGCTWLTQKWPHLAGRRRGAGQEHGRPGRRPPLADDVRRRARRRGARRAVAAARHRRRARSSAGPALAGARCRSTSSGHAARLDAARPVLRHHLRAPAHRRGLPRRRARRVRGPGAGRRHRASPPTSPQKECPHEPPRRDHPALGRSTSPQRPMLVFWEVTRACQLACRHCRASATPGALPGELTGAEGRDLIDQVAGFGRPYPILVLTGGDCLLRPDVFDLVAYADAARHPRRHVAVGHADADARGDPRMVDAGREGGLPQPRRRHARPPTTASAASPGTSTTRSRRSAPWSTPG